MSLSLGRKKKMAEIIEVANVAYEARDRAQAEISHLKGSAEKEKRAPHLPAAPACPFAAHRARAALLRPTTFVHYLR